MRTSLPQNCEAEEDHGRVGFDLECDGATWRASVSYATLARMFSAPRLDAPAAAVRESRLQQVGHSKAIARIVVERIRAGAMPAEPIVIS